MQSFIEKKSKMYAMNTKPTMNNMRGFTLVELMVAVFLGAIAVVAIYRGYISFTQGADAQEQIIEMQQNLRIGMHWLEKDIRRAGVHEEDKGADFAGFTFATANTIRFTMDLTGGGTDERDNDNDGFEDELDPDNIENPPGTILVYAEDIYGDGQLDDDGEVIEYSADGSGNLRRSDINVGGTVTIIPNVDVLNFVYFDKGDPKATPPVSPQRLSAPVTGGNLEEIDSIEVTLLVRTTNEDFRHIDKSSYRNFRDEEIFNAATDTVGDEKHLRRRAFSKNIKIRNAGL